MAASARISPKSVATSSRRHLLVFSNSPARPLRSSYISCLRRIVCRALSRFACTRRRRFASRSSSVSCTLFGPLPRRFPATIGAATRLEDFSACFLARVCASASALARRRAARRRRAAPTLLQLHPGVRELKQRLETDALGIRPSRRGCGREVSLDGSVRGVSRRRFEAVRRVRAPHLSNAPVERRVRPRRGVGNLWRTSSRRRSRRASAGLARRGSARASAAAEGASLSANLRASLSRRRGNRRHGRRRRGLGAGVFLSGRHRTRRARRARCRASAFASRGFASVRPRERVGNLRDGGGTVSAVRVA